MDTIEQLHITQFASYLRPRNKNAYKNEFGHVLFIGGDIGYAGAVCMAAKAALRVGAGLVSVATRPEHTAGYLAAMPEVMAHGVLSPKNLKGLIDKADVIAIGPGLGQSSLAKKFLQSVLQSKKPLVIDADALTLLAKKPMKHANWILTPHVGEAARLLKITTEKIEEDRLAAVKMLQKKWHGVCVLKGAGTLIADDEGVVARCDAGNPGMATAGMGDVLTGVIAGLLAQQFTLNDAAKCGVLVHAMAGDLAAKEGERGMMATDLLPFLRRLVNFH